MKLAPEVSHGFNTRRAHRAFDRLLNAYLQRESLATGFWGSVAKIGGSQR